MLHVIAVRPRIQWHTYHIEAHARRHTQFRLSLTSLIGTASRDRVQPPPCQPVSPILSRHRWTDVISMKGALGGWSGGGPVFDACTTLDGPHRRDARRCHSASPLTPTAGQCLLRWRRSHPSRVATAARQSITRQGWPRPGTRHRCRRG